MDFLGIGAVVVLIAMNGFFVAAEFSLVSSRRTRIAQLVAEGSAAAKIAQSTMEHLDSYIAATQLGITLASLALGWIGEPAVASIFEPLAHALPFPADWGPTIAHSLSVTVAFALVTIIHIVMGELVPKSIALQKPERTALFISRPLTLFRTVFRPVISLMNYLGNTVVRALGFAPMDGHSRVHSAEELEMLVRSSREAGVLEENEERLLRRAFDFSDIPVRQIMRPRTNVDAIAVDTPLPELLHVTGTSQYSRYPVYEGSIDTVIGILHSKDLLDAIAANPILLLGNDPDRAAAFHLRTLLRTPLFVPETVGVDDLLERMQRTKTQFAVVIDEYGGMAGVATMEDVIEELVGEVQDEFDAESNPIEARGETTVVDGLVSLSEIHERFSEPDGAVLSTTIGGYVAERLDRIPVLGDTVRYGNYDLRVEAMDGMRASKVRFIRRPTIADNKGK